MTKELERGRAIELRKNGWSLGDIVNELHVSKSGVYKWIKDAGLLDVPLRRSNYKSHPQTEESKKKIADATRERMKTHYYNQSYPNEKICPDCGKMLPISAFARRKRKIVVSYPRCKECESARVSDIEKSRYAENKKMAVKYLGGCCSECGYKRNITALEFHHLGSEDKEYNISIGLKTGRGIENIKPELEKCICLCANCHREVHHPECNNYI